MRRLDPSSLPPALVVPNDLAAAAQSALKAWRAAFDDQLEALERALQHPGQPGELTAIVREFARIAGDEADAAGKYAALEAHAGARQAAAAESLDIQASADGFRREADDLRQTLAVVREQLDAAQRLEGSLREAADAARAAHDQARRDHDDLRGAHEQLRHAHEALQGAHETLQRAHNESRLLIQAAEHEAADARRTADEATHAMQHARQIAAEATAAADGARRGAAEAAAREAESGQAYRELREVHESLALQLQQLRGDQRAADSRMAELEARYSGTVREADIQARELQAFQRRLEAAVQDAEERSRARVRERARLEREVTDARAAADMAAAEREAAHRHLVRLSDEVAALKAASAAREFDAREPDVREARAARLPVVDVFDTSLPWMTEPAEASAGPDAAPRDAALPDAVIAAPAPPTLQDAAVTTVDVMVDRGFAIESGHAPHGIEPMPVTFDAALTAPDDARREPFEGGDADAAEVGAAPGDAPVTPADNEIDAGHERAHPLDEPEEEAVAEAEVEVEEWEEQANEGEDEDEEEPTVADELAARPHADGAFSTLADALRAWTIEPDSQIGRPAHVTNDARPGASTMPPVRPAPPRWTALRASVRHDLTGRRVSITINHEVGQVVDLSTGGTQVITTAMLVPGQQVRVTFPGVGPLASGKARVVWSRLEPPSQGGGELQYRAGLAFTAIEPRTIERILNPTPDPGRKLR